MGSFKYHTHYYFLPTSVIYHPLARTHTHTHTHTHSITTYYINEEI